MRKTENTAVGDARAMLQHIPALQSFDLILQTPSHPALSAAVDRGVPECPGRTSGTRGSIAHLQPVSCSTGQPPTGWLVAVFAAAGSW